jgi:hypothetical protein
MTSLTKPEVSELAVVTTALDLWCEFLGGYFDGAAHAVGANDPVDFPKAELLFQQAPVTQPSELPANASLDTLSVALVWNEPTKKWIAWETVAGQRQQVAQTLVTVNFWVRAAGSQARARGKLAADRLHGLLNNSGETRALGQKGILRVRAGEPRAVASGDFTLYLVVAAMQLRYPIRSQTTP